ncbi:MAG: MerR family transcriptional regulator [Zetaproteobacteria bacterium]|nr:MAG: MerR family transcriptional regulator [Zetaproteobacteria bacterium]
MARKSTAVSTFSPPPLPDKLFFSIREVSELCGVEPHVLRYWEGEFHTIKPVKRSGNRRFYRKKDVEAILYIRHLLYDLNFTIRGARKVLMSGNVEQVLEQPDARASLRQVREELAAALQLLDS